MRGEILDGVERRRRWSDEQKLGIVMEVGLRGATVSDVARRHAVTRQQIYSWRQALKCQGTLRSEERPVFLPVGSLAALPAPTEPFGMTPSPDPVAAPASTASVEIVLRNGRRLCVPACVDDEALAHLIRVVETA